MSPRRCVVEGCKSVAGQHQHQGVKFHTFPANDDVRKVWLENCRLPANKSISKSTLVCSRHFRRADFQTLKNSKHLLKTGAVPTIFPWGNLPHQDLKGTPKSSSDSSTDAPSSASTAVSAKIAPSRKTASRSKPAGNVDASTKQRSASAEEKNSVNKSKADKAIARKSLDSVTSGAAKAENASPNAAVSEKGSELMSSLVSGAKLEAQDLTGSWHHANVVEVDHGEQEVLINFEKNKSKGPA